MVIKQGEFRRVWLTEKWAFKTPRLNGWVRFLEGLRFNRREFAKWQKIGSQVFEYKGGSVKLCPITFHLPFGLLVVMRRVQPLPKDYFTDLSRFMRTQFLFRTVKENITDTDYIKTDNYGFLDDNLVMIDYAGCGDTKLKDAVTVKHIEYRADNKWGKW